jgi:hypothetical protein
MASDYLQGKTKSQLLAEADKLDADAALEEMRLAQEAQSKVDAANATKLAEIAANLRAAAAVSAASQANPTPVDLASLPPERVSSLLKRAFYIKKYTGFDASAPVASSGYAYLPNDPRSKGWADMARFVGPVEQIDIQ